MAKRRPKTSLELPQESDQGRLLQLLNDRFRRIQDLLTQADGASGSAAATNIFNNITNVTSDVADAWRPVKNPVDKDATFDGTTHLLQEGYTSNALAEAAYPSLATYLSDNSLPSIDRTTDTIDYAAIMESGWSLPANGGMVVLPRGVAIISRGLAFGNGTRTTPSTRNGVQIVGQGIGGNYEGDPRACIIKPKASISVPLLTFRGRMFGCALENVSLDATTSYWAPCCLQVYHVVHSTFRRIHCRNASQWGIRAEIDNTATYDYWSCGVHWHQIQIEARSSSSGWLFGDSSAPYSQQGDLCRHYIYGLEMNGVSGTQTGIQIGMCDSCTFEHVFIYGFADNKQIVIRPQAAAPQYPENITFKDLMCGAAGADPDLFWSIDESLATWAAGDHKITIEGLHQESTNPAFPSDSRFTGYAKDGTFYNGWGGGAGTGIVRTHYDLAAGANAIAAPTSSPDLQIISIKQNAGASGSVTWNAVYKFNDNFKEDLRANRRSLYTFCKAGSEYHLISSLVGVL